MSRIPPALLYLTVFNPTLRPTNTTVAPEDEEDAEEQAHVLFYTARERAVSRDKILRQVGLAKALINFAGMFDPLAVCDNVHSQSRRMVMLSPEPDFWIHACVELAKTPKQVTPKRKDPKSKGKEPAPKPDITYDYHDGSVGDLSLRSHLLKGYELFKLLHGSFSSILLSLGQQALELQLERFFTVWGWKWDMEEDTFSSHLGIPLHPLHRSLTPMLDEFVSRLPYNATSFMINNSLLIPSTALASSSYAAVLPGHIATRIPPPPPPLMHSEASSSAATVVPLEETEVTLPHSSEPGTKSPAKSSEPDSNKTFMPGMNIDMKHLKWSWPGYLTFGKSKSSSPSIPTTPVATDVVSPQPQAITKPSLSTEIKADEDIKDTPQLVAPAVDVDTESLQDAISSEHPHSTRTTPPSLPSIEPSPASIPLPLDDDLAFPASEEQQDRESNKSSPDQTPASPQEEQTVDDPQDNEPSSEQQQIETLPVEAADSGPHIPTTPPLLYLPTTVHLATEDAPTMTRKMKVWHVTRNATTFALVVDLEHSQDELPMLSHIATLFDDVELTVESEESKTLEASIPTLSKILEPKDKHIISTGHYTLSPPQNGFTSRSEHFFNGQQILRGDLDAQEVFSRGQNPQHWYISKKGLGSNEAGEAVEGEAYMEIARKESTLTDAGNALAGVIRRFAET
ncbi:hypothetical protein EIP91_003203 [Steccherinum ochraceum]|uniref:CCZ1/INTU/HSP4 first Longin domain-containing protein n=1 Tax=Steccherinum ochraceum TaxID=92696 RepID=A0A4R0RSD7_9APHY|nr:hypothetical protein EIP91_003203 [Steccherinum ochraceum]